MSEQTKTIKYHNDRDSQADSNSQSITERQYRKQIIEIKTSLQKNAINQNYYHSNHQDKIVVIDTLEDFNQPKERPKNQKDKFLKSKRKKGKSMDLDEIIQGVRYPVTLQTKSKQGQKIIINNDFLNDFRARNSISEMKEYQHKSLLNKPFKKKVIQNTPVYSKKKKSKNSADLEIKNIKKEIKHLIETNPAKIKQKSQSKKRENRKVGENSKELKPWNKSVELLSRPKNNNIKTKRSDSEYRSYGLTMPLTSKLNSLYSNTSSVFESRKEINILHQHHSYIIPTQQSLQEIEQIRKYQSYALNSKPSSGHLRSLKKITPIASLEENQVNTEEMVDNQTTQNIINHYLSMLNENEIRLSDNKQSKQLGDISRIYEHSGNNYQIFEEMSSKVLQKIENKTEQNKQLKLQQEKVQQLDQIMKFIKEKSRENASISNNEIISQITSFLQQKINIDEKFKPEGPISQQNRYEDIKESIDEDINLLNFQFLDKTLRDRESYLQTRKEKEIIRLDDLKSKSKIDQKQYMTELNKLQKWTKHQIKQVKNTRANLWRGITNAKNLLLHENSSETLYKNEKAKQMMKSLSQKYLDSFRKKKQKKRQKINHYDKEKRLKGQKDDSEEEEDQLKLKRIVQTQLSSPIQQFKNQKQYLNVEKNGFQLDQNLLDSENKSNFKFQAYQMNIDDQEGDGQGKQLFESVDSQNPIKLINKMDQPRESMQSSQQTGLNLQKLICQIQHEDSFTEQQIEKMVKQVDKPKQSLLLPYKLNLQDKEDIYQFIFLDLCIQMTDQYGVKSTVMNKIYSFIKNMKEQAKKQKGFKTNTNAVKDYLHKFFSYLTSEQKLLGQIYDNLQKPLGPTALDILKYMHAYDDEGAEEDSTEAVFILDINVFQSFEKVYLPTLQFDKYYQEEQKQHKRKVFLKNAIHIHNKAIYDALNQTLDKFRPFGVWGEPFAWKKAAKFYHNRDGKSKKEILLNCIKRTIDYGSYMCGFMVDKEDSVYRNNPNISQTYIQQIRDDRLSRMLANDLQEGEQKMLFIDDEQTEILVEVAHIIFHQQLLECCREILIF